MKVGAGAFGWAGNTLSNSPSAGVAGELPAALFGE
jgi:hypothetical protein